MRRIQWLDEITDISLLINASVMFRLEEHDESGTARRPWGYVAAGEANLNRTFAPRPGPQFRSSRWLLPLAGLLMLSVVLYVYSFSIIVTVENVGDQPLQNVAIVLSGKDYELGVIEPGASEMEFTFPTGESAVKLVWIVDSVVHESWIGGYVTLGSNGAIDVEVEGAEVVELAGDRAILEQ
jgi:hypothetical protein